MHERLPKLKRFPLLLPSENLVRLELQEGIPIFKAIRRVYNAPHEVVVEQGNGGLQGAIRHVKHQNALASVRCPLWRAHEHHNGTGCPAVVCHH